MHAPPFTRRQRLLLFVAEGFGFGRTPIAPGTFGSLPGVSLMWLLQNFEAGPLPCLTVWAICFACGIPICRRAAELRGKHDPGNVVWDEITAFPLLATVAQPGWEGLLLGFILFRIFDIAKPWPVHRLERLPGGLGIMADDQAAGLWAGLILAAAQTWLL
ncbi:MAG: Phosphatidylglycerophosphatase [Planctomycetota bacterium]|jgi:phosphatidylglycerophosphatase A